MTDNFRRISDVRTYGELLDYLRNWRSPEDPQVYDFGGMVHLLTACLDNLRQLAVDGELEDIGNFLDDEQRLFLAKLSRLAQESTDD